MTVNDVLVEAKYSPAASACYFTEVRTPQVQFYISYIHS